MGLFTEIFRLSDTTSGIESYCMFSGMTGILSSFSGENANIAKLALIMAVMIFFLGLARIIFRRKEND